MSTRAKPLYDNCIMTAPDGEVLCTCDRKKAEWYVIKELADIVTDQPTYTIRLKFEPKGRAVGEVGKYYQTPKENKCVVCGEKDSYIRKNVVPRDYRRHFPRECCCLWSALLFFSFFRARRTMLCYGVLG